MMVLGGMIIACSSSDTGNGSSSGTSSSGDNSSNGSSGNPSSSTSTSSGSTSTSSFCCGLNGDYYDCNSSQALLDCTKGIFTGCKSRATECPK